MNEHPGVAQQKRMGVGMMVLAWIVLLGLGALFFGDVLERQFNPNQSLETRYGENGAREVVLQRNKFGHYVTAGSINGEPVTFMLDTGATGVAVPVDVAEQLNLRRGRPFRTQTANGVATSYATTLTEVAVGDIALQEVSAAIVPGLADGQILLGMSFLKHIEFTQRGDTLILRQYL